MLQGGSDNANFAGASLGLEPHVPDNAGDVLNPAAGGDCNCFEGEKVVEDVARGFANAQSDMNNGDRGNIRVSVLPVEFTSQSTGPIHLRIYRVEGADGQSRYVDNVGRVYRNFEAWKTENDLPPGKMTFPRDGLLGAPGETRLETTNTPNVDDTFWKKTRNVAEVAALAGGVVASGVLLLGSGGLAAPVAGARVVAGASAAVTNVSTAAHLLDRARHDQPPSQAIPRVPRLTGWR